MLDRYPRKKFSMEKRSSVLLKVASSAPSTPWSEEMQPPVYCQCEEVISLRMKRDLHTSGVHWRRDAVRLR